MKTICINLGEESKTQPTAATITQHHPEIGGLLEKAAGGNFEAFGELYSIYLDRIYRYVFYQVFDRMTAEDITEEVFLKAWKVIRTCKGKENTFLPWLYRIAHNHLMNTFRSMKKLTSIEKNDFMEISDRTQEPETKVECQELLETIAGLPENQKQVIILKFIEGMDNREIGKITGKSEGAIRISQMRALTALRQKLGDEEGGHGN